MIQKLKANSMDNFDTEYIDFDALIKLYIEQFRLNRQILL